MRIALAEMMVAHRDVRVAGPMQLRYEVQPQRHLMAAIVAAHLRLEGCRAVVARETGGGQDIANVIDPNGRVRRCADGGFFPLARVASVCEIILQSASSSQL